MVGTEATQGLLSSFLAEQRVCASGHLLLRRNFAAKERRKFANLEETEEAAAGEVGLRHVVGERRS